MTRKYPFTPQEFKDIYSKVPKLCVEAVVIKDKGVVLTKRSHSSWHGQWHIPGSTLYYLEKVTDAITRIASEEIGLTSITIVKPLGYLEYPSEVQQRGFGYSVSLPFLCTTQQTLSDKNGEGEQIKIFTTLPENLVFEQRQLLLDVLNQTNSTR